MEQHFHQVVSQSRVIYAFTNFHMHEFIEHNKRKTAEGNCLILQLNKQEQTGSNYYLKMNNFEFCKRVNQSIFIKVQYQRSSSYLFFNQFEDNLVYAISIPNQSPNLGTFEEILRNNGSLTEYRSPELKYQVKVRIDFHIDHVLQNEVIINFNKTAKIGKAIGGFFGKINNKIVTKATEAETRYQDELKRISRQSFSDSTKSKWDKIVQKASNINDKLTEVIKPLTQTINKAVSDVGQKYKNSENAYVKTIREFTKETQDSINEGFNEPQLNTGSSQSGAGNLPPGVEDCSVNQMGQHLILNEEMPEKSSYPDI